MHHLTQLNLFLMSIHGHLNQYSSWFHHQRAPQEQLHQLHHLPVMAPVCTVLTHVIDYFETEDSQRSSELCCLIFEGHQRQRSYYLLTCSQIISINISRITCWHFLLAVNWWINRRLWLDLCDTEGNLKHEESQWSSECVSQWIYDELTVSSGGERISMCFMFASLNEK